MHLSIILIVFAVIFVAELPDKSMFAALILGTKFPAKFVWLGAAAAFFTHVVIAVTAGRLLTLLPHHILEAVVSILFLVGAALIFFGKHGLDEHISHPHLGKKELHSPRKVFITAYTVIFIGEWGDITQIAIANYAARYHDTINVAIGATLGLWSVTGIAIVVGTKALTLIPPKVLQTVTGLILLGFGLFSGYAAVT